MSSLVKNQIAKQLARFTKNFSPNKISVKFLKGEGELHNLELDEKIISDLLELPPWLRITKAVCNKISAKIHWTRLKTDPICLYLDCVEIDMEEVILSQTKSTSAPPLRPPPPQTKEKQANRYGFVEKVVDGMFVQMNSVIISFKSLQFQASVQISRLIVQSTTPEWKPDDLRNTRIKDEGRGEVLTFKEIHWSTLRIDANAVVPENSREKSSPIRLITSQSSLHITIKKKLEDCSVVSACLELLLDDILWVLTQSQLQALVSFMNSINKAVEQSGAKKEPVPNGTTPGQTAQYQTPTYTSSNLQNNTDADYQGSDFCKYDLLETSYHLRTGCIDLHLCDDSNEKDQANSTDTLAGGAMQIHINKLAIDNYPYHLAGTSRAKWVCHNEASLTRAYWVNQLLNTFRNNIKSRKVPQPDGMGTRPTRSKAEGTSSTDGPSQPPSSPANHHPPPQSPTPSHRSTPPSPQHQRIAPSQNQRRPVFMYENCYLIRCEEFSVMPVTTYKAPDEGVAFLSSDKKALYLPTDMPAFQIDYTQYYYPTWITSPVPCPNLFVQLNPVQLTLDTTTCIWFNRFLRTILSVADPVGELQPQQPSTSSHVDIRIEALMPKIILPCPSEPGCHYRESRPQALQIQMSQVALTNSRVGSNSSQTELLMLLQQFSSSKLYTEFNVFPNDVNDIRPLSNLAWLKDFGVVEDPVRIERLLNGLRTGCTGPCRPSQVWCLTADQVWADFLGVTCNKNRPMPFIEALPLRLWICTPVPNNTPEINPTSPGRPDDEPCRIPQPSSVASSPGCVRSHHAVPPSSAIHLSSSSPNLKHGSKDATQYNRIGDINTRKELGNSPPSSSSLPASPKSRSIACDPLSGLKKELHEDIGINGKSFPVASLSKNSQSLSSLSQEELNGGIDSSSQGSSRNEAENLDRTIPNGLSNERINTTSPGPENAKGSSGVTNKGQGPPGHVPNGGSSRTNDEAPNLRKAFGSYSSTEDENLSDYPLDPPKVADTSVIAIIPADFAVQFDHFQYIFLLRLQESLVKMQEELDSEARKHLGECNSNSDAPSTPSVTFSLLAKRGEVSIILPPGPELSNSRGTSSASSYLDPGFVSDGETGLPDVGTDGMDVQEKSPHTRPDIISPLSKEEHSIPSLKSARGDLLPVPDRTSGADQSGRSSTSPMCDSTDGWIPQDGDKGVSKRRRGSDGSCCSSQLGTSVESSARSSARSIRSGRIVSIFTAEGSDLHLCLQMEGEDITVKVALQDLQIDEKGNHNFEKYLNQKSFKPPHESSTMVPHPLPSSPPVVSVRAEFGPGAESNTPSAGERGFAHVLLDNVSLSLMMSNIESLSECFDDEILLPKMPFYVELKSSSLCIRDDKPPRLLSTPPSLPLNVNLENISIFRNQDAVINIKALNLPSGIRGTDGCTGEGEEAFRGDLNRSMSRLSRTTSDLSLAESISSRSDNDSERECMKAQLSVSRAALHAVQDERQALLKTIERLQYELAMSNREQDRLQAKVIAYQSGGTAARRKTHH